MNVLWLVFSGRRNVKPKTKKLMKNIKNLEDIRKEIWKKYEDKDGGGSVQEISRLMKIFKDRW